MMVKNLNFDHFWPFFQGLSLIIYCSRLTWCNDGWRFENFWDRLTDRLTRQTAGRVQKSLYEWKSRKRIWRQFFGCNNQQFQLDIIAIYHSNTKSEKSNDTKSNKCPKTPDLGNFGLILSNFGPGQNQKNLMVPQQRLRQNLRHLSTFIDASHISG